MFMRRLSIVLLNMFILFACQKDDFQKNLYFKLPKKLKEVSGITCSQSHDIFWSIEDSGNKNIIYGLDLKGEISKTIAISNTQNIDWEEITTDDEGALYVGDFGNNNNTRKDLAIYKIDRNDLTKSSVVAVQQTSFYYPEQTAFPPKKKAFFYDCEAFFEKDGYFYLFTKNRSKDFDGTTFLYKIPNKQGNFAAKRIGEFITCSDYNNCRITGAALSPDKNKVVLLSHSKVWLFENFKGDAFLNGKATQLELQHYSQKEAICFLTNDILLIADERTKDIGGNVYKVSLTKLKSKP